MKLPMKIVLAIIAAFICIALTQIDFSEAKKKEIKEAKEAVVDKAFHTKGLSTFVTAIKTAKLKDKLSNESPITIFAPNDSAFSSLPEGKFAELMKSNNKEELKEIINYHVVAGVISHSDLEDGQVLKTLQGDSIKISLGDDMTSVNGVKMVKANIGATNGIIHIINGVMFPSAENDTSVKQ